MKISNDDVKKLVDAWLELEERCPDCGGMESGCHEVGCLSEEWTDADTKQYKEGLCLKLREVLDDS
jgi:hypothetical protein